MAATLAMERSKRQIKPNLTRTDFGYVERTRPINKQPKKPKLMEEDEGGGGGGDARNLTVDFLPRLLLQPELLLKGCAQLHAGVLSMR